MADESGTTTMEAPPSAGAVQTTPKIGEAGAGDKAFSMPEKFKGKSAEEIARSYSELEKHLTAKGKHPEQQTSQAAIPDNSLRIGAAPSDDDEDADTILKNSGLTEQEIAEQWSKDGKLTDEQYTKIRASSKSKPTRSIINDLVKGRLAVAQYKDIVIRGVNEKIAEKAGGKDRLDNLLSWAAGALDDSEKRYAQAMLSDPAMAERGYDYIVMRQQQQNGSSGSKPLITGSTSGSSGTSGAKNAEEYRKLTALAANGDIEAHKKLAATTRDDMAKW